MEWFKEEIERIKQERGSRQVDELISLVLYDRNYLLHFSHYEQAGYEEVPIETLKENMANKKKEKYRGLEKTKSQEASIALFTEEMKYVATRLSKEI